MPGGVTEDDLSVRRTAALQVIARMVGVGAGAGALIAVGVALLYQGPWSPDLVGYVSIAAMVGLLVGAVTNLLDALVAVLVLRSWPRRSSAGCWSHCPSSWPPCPSR